MDTPYNKIPVLKPRCKGATNWSMKTPIQEHKEMLSKWNSYAFHAKIYGDYPRRIRRKLMKK